MLSITDVCDSNQTTSTFAPDLLYYSNYCDVIAVERAIDNMCSVIERHENRARSLKAIFALNVNQRPRHAVPQRNVRQFVPAKFCKKRFGRIDKPEV